MPPPPPNPAIDPGFKPAAGPIVKCRNCRNAAGTDCHAVKADDGYVYCAKNCYWSYYVRKSMEPDPPAQAAQPAQEKTKKKSNTK